MRRLAAIAVVALFCTGTSVSAGPVPQPVDCEGPVPDAQPGTQEWTARDIGNMFCAEQRHLDQASHPLLATPAGAQPANDGYREPTRHDGVRFRFETVTIAGLSAELYRPCAAGTCSAPVPTYEPPYPAVVTVHGGLSRKELHWWSSQPLAEAGYMVVAFKSAGISPTTEETTAVLDWLPSPDNPHADELDAARIGLAGHSAGGVIASALGQQDARVGAIVSWDRAQSGQMPDDLVMRVPAMFLFADYNCQRVPVCQPEPYTEVPDPDGPGNKGEDFVRVSAAGVDSMQIALRAALHLDFVPSELAGNRYVESVTMYFTTAWFDRYLKDDPDGFTRLTASSFDGSADARNISQGSYDPARAAAAGDPYAGNVPYSIEGMPVANRLSFYYRSKCDIAVPGSGGRVASGDIRVHGCGP